MKTVSGLRWSVSLLLPALILIGCAPEGGNVPEPEQNSDPWDIDSRGIPRFVDNNYIELGKIHRISRFRSGVGHSYTDDFEDCRSMKHYYQPTSNSNWGNVAIFSPVSGTITRVENEWAGTQIHIRSAEYPAFYFIIFHINPATSFLVGDTVSAGQQLGRHIGSQTMSDIAVGVNTPDGWRLISFSAVMTDTLFRQYQNRGVIDREQLVITEAERDADPLTCNGETFTGNGTLPNWVYLN